MSRSPYQVVSLKRDPQCLNPRASLVLIYRPTTVAELAERWTELPQVSDESRSFFIVHTGYFSNIPKCIKQSSSPVGLVLSPVLYRAPSVRINLIVCLIELCTSFELRDKFGGGAGYNYVKRG
ncbi:hypothetical protein TNCV_5026221 [Trichonephila clavipes]|uniref:Uncharacterized protein n=1 Tax=Trichonephila clavipes TaxID=2585209 RepID=A0A8X6RPV2_TRICX|nr:hypothetical protein TNCV_5026221 [Trichonephila clavipes]